jgi:hypothetical protein
MHNDPRDKPSSEPAARSEPEPMLELYSPEWFRWVEGRFLDPDDPPVRYLKKAAKGKPDGLPVDDADDRLSS